MVIGEKGLDRRRDRSGARLTVMHLLRDRAAIAGRDGRRAVDLGQTPADIVVLSFSDSDLAALAAAWSGERRGRLPSLRLASLAA